MTFENIPSELKSLRQWVTWRIEDGKKIPYNPQSQLRASTTDPSTWSTYEEALATVEDEVVQGLTTPHTAARRLLAAFTGDPADV